MKRTAIISAWMLSVCGAFATGYYLSGLSGNALEPARHASAAFDAALSTAAQPPAQGSYPAGSRDTPSTASAADPTTGLDAARLRAADGDIHAAIEILYEYLLDEPHDGAALWLLSELFEKTGQMESALQPLVAIVQYPATPEAASRARRRIGMLVDAREQQLINSGELTRLVAYFERLVELDSGYDGHRLKLARWLLRTDALDQAERLTREIGSVGVDDAELDALRAELAMARMALPIERSGGAMFTEVRVQTRKSTARLRLLIDTGATMSGINRSRLERLGAVQLAGEVPVHTANGRVLMPVYRIQALRVGQVDFGALDVLGLSDLPGQADGLLGMDVLDRLSPALPAAVPLLESVPSGG